MVDLLNAWDLDETETPNTKAILPYQTRNTKAILPYQTRHYAAKQQKNS